MGICACLLSSPSVRSQSTAPVQDAPTLQALLTEVRQLRQDLQTVAGVARRAQILIYRLYLQQAIVERASETLDNTKSVLAQLQRQAEYENEQIKRLEEQRDATTDAAERAQLEAEVKNWKARNDVELASEQGMQTKITDLEIQFRTEREKLEQLQAQLDKLDSELENTNIQAAKH